MTTIRRRYDLCQFLKYVVSVVNYFLKNTCLIDNANKYTHNSTITASAQLETGNLQINISDTGRGINEELVKDLTALQYIEDQISYKERRSLGFYIMAVLTKKLGGYYSINSQKWRGTSLDFVIPGLKQYN